MDEMAILPGTGRWRSEGLTEGVPSPARCPLHHFVVPLPVPVRI